MKTSFLYTKILIVGILLFSLQSGSFGQTNTQTGQKQKVYTCPMHPDVHQTKPGKCPRCGMTLELQKEPQQATPKDRTKMKKEIMDTASINRHKHIQRDTSHMKKRMKPDSIKHMMDK
ncbi:MAG TPA: heavy metal-binding domain-containing protein [Bacteroidales bacterium]|nr:heavy metal-binding domain-containing protein [Bacteroidales bacterium]